MFVDIIYGQIYVSSYISTQVPEQRCYYKLFLSDQVSASANFFTVLLIN